MTHSIEPWARRDYRKKKWSTEKIIAYALLLFIASAIIHFCVEPKVTRAKVLSAGLTNQEYQYMLNIHSDLELCRFLKKHPQVQVANSPCL